VSPTIQGFTTRNALVSLRVFTPALISRTCCGGYQAQPCAPVALPAAVAAQPKGWAASPERSLQGPRQWWTWRLRQNGKLPRKSSRACPRPPPSQCGTLAEGVVPCTASTWWTRRSGAGPVAGQQGMWDRQPACPGGGWGASLSASKPWQVAAKTHAPAVDAGLGASQQPPVLLATAAAYTACRHTYLSPGNWECWEPIEAMCHMCSLLPGEPIPAAASAPSSNTRW
jgi:hypothetical protein